MATGVALACLISLGGAGTATALILLPQPNNTVRPVVKGSLVQGATLTADRGSWTGTPPPTFTYQWRRCATSCSAIPGATSPSYRLGGADVSRRMQVTVTGRNALGSTSASSARSGPVRSAFRIPAPLEPGGSGRLKRLRARIAIKGRITDTGARFTSVVVSTVRGARLRVRCRGEGCPYRRTSRRFRRKRLRLRALERSLPAGAVIELTLTKRNMVGRFTRVRVRRGRVPLRTDRCLKPGARKPSRCR